MSRPDIRSKRWGRFYISSNLIFDNEPIVSWIMSQCIVLEASYHPMQDYFEYWVTCWRFPEIPPGRVIPMYVWTISPEGGLDFEEVPEPQAPVVPFPEYEIPSFEEAAARIHHGERSTPLDHIVYDNEPAGVDNGLLFRSQLRQLIAYVTRRTLHK